MIRETVRITTEEAFTAYAVLAASAEVRTPHQLLHDPATPPYFDPEVKTIDDYTALLTVTHSWLDVGFTGALLMAMAEEEEITLTDLESISTVYVPDHLLPPEQLTPWNPPR